MDQIFERFERLFKSWTTQDVGSHSDRTGKKSGDPDVDAAMDELDDFLSAARGNDQASERERARKRAEEEARNRTSARHPSTARDPRLAAAYEYLGLPFGTPLEEVKAKYKKLLLKHHPDRHAGHPENVRKATETSARINEAWRIIESWATTGHVPD